MKLVLFNIMILSSMIFSSSVFAISDEEVVKKCLDAGKAKISAQAKASGCVIDLNEIEVQGVDNRWYNPSAYVWYRTKENCINSQKIMVLIQYDSAICISNEAAISSSLKDTVGTVVDSSSKITSPAKNGELNVSDKSINTNKIVEQPANENLFDKNSVISK